MEKRIVILNESMFRKPEAEIIREFLGEEDTLVILAAINDPIHTHIVRDR